MFQPNENHAILNELAAEAQVASTDPRLTGLAVALYGSSGDGGRVGAAGLPIDYKGVTLTNSPARETEAKVYKVLRSYVATFTRNDGPIKSVYLWSEAKGNGKTTTAAALVNEWIRATVVGALKLGKHAPKRPAFFLDTNEWQSLFNQFNRPRVPDSIAEPAAATYYRWLDAAQRAPFVALDDIGVRQATEAFRGDVHSVVNHRTANRMPTVFTSNEPLDSLADTFDERLYDRARDQCVDIEFQGYSQRGIRK